MQSGCRVIIAFASLICVSATALSQPLPEPAPSDDITVTAQKIKPRDIEKAAMAVTPPGNLYHDPLPQFQAAVCPGVVGVSSDFAALMVARIRKVADRAKIRLSTREKCAANLLVIFLPNGQAAMQNLLHRGPWLFDSINPYQLRDLVMDPALKDLASDPGPVHAWVNTEFRGRFGEPMSGRDDPGDPAVLKTPDASWHLFLRARRDIIASVVVIDIGAVQGMSVIQVADYVAMRGLVQTRPPSEPGTIGTILSLFDESDKRPTQLTSFDLGYLRAIYGLNPNVAGVTKVGRVAYEVKKAAKEAMANDRLDERK